MIIEKMTLSNLLLPTVGCQAPGLMSCLLSEGHENVLQRNSVAPWEFVEDHGTELNIFLF